MTTVTHVDFRRSRMRMRGEAVIRAEQGDWRAPLHDVSLSGMHVRCPPAFAANVGQAVLVELRCDRARGLSLRARVARCEAGDLGLQFEPMSPWTERELQFLIEAHGEMQGSIPIHGGED